MYKALSPFEKEIYNAFTYNPQFLEMVNQQKSLALYILEHSENINSFLEVSGVMI